MSAMYKPRTEGFSFEWAVGNISLYTQLEETSLDSPAFTVDSLGYTKFFLSLREEQVKNYEALELSLARAGDCGTRPVSLSFDVTIRDSDCPIQTTKVTHTFEKPLEMQSIVTWRKPTFRMHEPLTIICKIYADEIPQKDLEVSDECLSKDFVELLHNKTLSDVDLHCRGQIFKAHSAMLRAWSPVFANLLETEDVGSPVARLDIEDMSPQILQAFLEYMYSGKLDISTIYLYSGLYEAAMKYKIAELRRRICSFPEVKKACTSVKSERVVFSWCVEDFSKLVINRDYFSRVIRAFRVPYSEMKLILRIGGEGGSTEDVHLTLRRLFPGRNRPFAVSCKVVVENSNHSLVRCHRFKDNADWNLPTFISKTWLYQSESTHLPSDTLMLRFEFDMSSGEFVTRKLGNSFVVETNVGQPHNFRDLSRRLIVLRRSRRFEDFKIRVEDGEISAHSFVLCARSPVFSSMLESSMIEKQTSSVYIEDSDIETVDGLLEYMYSGKMKDESYESVSRLYSLADKYQVLKLKTLCASILKSKLTTENVGDQLYLADIHNDTSFKEYVIEYIRRHSERVVLTDAWYKLKIARPHLVRNILWPDDI